MLRLFEDQTRRLAGAHENRTRELGDEINILWGQLLQQPAQGPALRQRIADLEKEKCAENKPLVDYMSAAVPFLNEHHARKATFDERIRAGDAAAAAEWEEEYARMTQRYVAALHPELTQRAAGGTETNARDVVQKRARCTNCNGAKFRLYAREGRRVCLACGNSELAPDRMQPGYEARAQSGQTRQYKYMRLNHLRELLRALMATQQRPPPQEVEMLVRDAVARRARHLHIANVTPAVVRDILRTHKLSRYFKYSTAIAARINPAFRPPQIEPAHCERLLYLFALTEAPYERIKNKICDTRKNFMSYTYVVAQLCRLCGYNSYLSLFPRLKSDELQCQQDQFWEAVCRELNWAYYPTIGNGGRKRPAAAVDDSKPSDSVKP
jgi:hypothetical protein